MVDGTCQKYAWSCRCCDGCFGRVHSVKFTFALSAKRQIFGERSIATKLMSLKGVTQSRLRGFHLIMIQTPFSTQIQRTLAPPVSHPMNNSKRKYEHRTRRPPNEPECRFECQMNSYFPKKTICSRLSNREVFLNLKSRHGTANESEDYVSFDARSVVRFSLWNLQFDFQYGRSQQLVAFRRSPSKAKG